MLDIVITHYKEPWEVCRKLFLTLDLQRCVKWSDIRITIVNDGGYQLPDEQLKALAFRWKAKEFLQLNIPHGGISRARNAGIENGTEPWIMFCDCDDAFFNIYALEDIMRVLASPVDGRFDILWSRCWEENEDGILMAIPDFRTFVFCHGKVYSRRFLLDQRLKFEEGLNFNEDSCFNAVAIARTQNSRIGAIRSSSPVYAWIRRTNSVTTSGREDEATYCNFRRNLIVTEENRLHRPDQYPAMVTRTSYDTFYVLTGGKISEECKEKILTEFRPWIAERLDVFGVVEPEILDQIRAISKSELTEGEVINDSHEEVREWVAWAAEET